MQEMYPLALLAGGMAQRLRPVTQTIPKALVEMQGEPFIVHQLRLLKKQGIARVVICIGYRGSQIKACVGNGKSLGISVAYSSDGKQLLGTGGALKKALPLLGDTFWVMYGDSYLDTDFRSIDAFFLAHGKEALGVMAIFKNNNKWDRSNIVYRQGMVKRYDKKRLSGDMQYIDYGLSILRREALSERKETVFDLEKVYQDLIKRGAMRGYEVKKRFYEIGSFKGLEDTERYFAGKKQEKK